MEKIGAQQLNNLVGPKAYLALLNGVLSAVSFGYALGVLNLPEAFIRCWISNLSSSWNEVSITNQLDCNNAIELSAVGAFDDITFKWALSTAIVPLFGVIGGLIAAPMANNLGRKTTILYNAIFNILICLIFLFIQKINLFWVFILARALLGINTGISINVGPVYISEIAPAEKIGMFGTCFQLGVASGFSISYLFGLNEILGKNDTWVYVLALNALPAIFQVILSFIVPESPTFLISNGKFIEAKAANLALKGSESTLDETRTIERQNAIKNIQEIFKNPGVKKATIAIMFMQAFQQLNGINAIFFYSGSIYASAGIPSSYSGLMTLGSSLANILFVCIAIFFVDKIGRKKLFIISFCVMALMAVVTTIFLSFPDNQTICYLTIIPITVFIAGFEAGPGALTYPLAGECIPDTYKAGSQSLGIIVNNFFAFLVAVLFPPLQNWLNQYVFIPFSIMCLLGAVYVRFFVVETTGKNVDQVIAEYAK